MIPVRQFTSSDTAEVMLAHAKACRERIQNAKARPAPVAKFVIGPKCAEGKTLYDFPAGPIFVHEPVRDFIRVSSDEKPKPLAPQKILAEVCLKHGVTLADMRSMRRQTYLVLAKREACFRLRRDTQMSFPQIGELLNKDHSTVVHAFYKYLAENPDEVRACERASLKAWKEVAARNVIRNNGYRGGARKQQAVAP